MHNIEIRYELSTLPIFSGINSTYAEFVAKTDSASSASMSEFRKKLQGAVDNLWNEDGTLIAFSLVMYALIEEQYTDAWASGMEMAGLSPSEMSDSERLALLETIRQAELHIDKLGVDIVRQKMNPSGNLDQFTGRLNMWANGYLKAQNTALMYASSDPKLKWVEGDTKKKCLDCLYYDGKVLRASEWMRMQVYPQSPSLQCTGINCGCNFVPTDEPITIGKVLAL